MPHTLNKGDGEVKTFAITQVTNVKQLLDHEVMTTLDLAAVQEEDSIVLWILDDLHHPVDDLEKYYTFRDGEVPEFVIL